MDSEHELIGALSKQTGWKADRTHLAFLQALKAANDAYAQDKDNFVAAIRKVNGRVRDKRHAIPFLLKLGIAGITEVSNPDDVWAAAFEAKDLILAAWNQDGTFNGVPEKETPTTSGPDEGDPGPDPVKTEPPVKIEPESGDADLGPLLAAEQSLLAAIEVATRVKDFDAAIENNLAAAVPVYQRAIRLDEWKIYTIDTEPSFYKGTYQTLLRPLYDSKDLIRQLRETYAPARPPIKPDPDGPPPPSAAAAAEAERLRKEQEEADAAERTRLENERLRREDKGKGEDDDGEDDSGDPTAAAVSIEEELTQGPFYFITKEDANRGGYLTIEDVLKNEAKNKRELGALDRLHIIFQLIASLYYAQKQYPLTYGIGIDRVRLKKVDGSVKREYVAYNDKYVFSPTWIAVFLTPTDLTVLAEENYKDGYAQDIEGLFTVVDMITYTAFEHTPAIPGYGYGRFRTAGTPEKYESVARTPSNDEKAIHRLFASSGQESRQNPEKVLRMGAKAIVSGLFPAFTHTVWEKDELGMYQGQRYQFDMVTDVWPVPETNFHAPPLLVALYMYKDKRAQRRLNEFERTMLPVPKPTKTWQDTLEPVPLPEPEPEPVQNQKDEQAAPPASVKNNISPAAIVRNLMQAILILYAPNFTPIGKVTQRSLPPSAYNPNEEGNAIQPALNSLYRFSKILDEHAGVKDRLLDIVKNGNVKTFSKDGTFPYGLRYAKKQEYAWPTNYQGDEKNDELSIAIQDKRGWTLVGVQYPLSWVIPLMHAASKLLDDENADITAQIEGFQRYAEKHTEKDIKIGEEIKKIMGDAVEYANVIPKFKTLDEPPRPIRIKSIINQLETIESNSEFQTDGRYDHKKIAAHLLSPLRQLAVRHAVKIRHNPALSKHIDTIGFGPDPLSSRIPKDPSTRYYHTLSVTAQILDAIDTAKPVDPVLLDRVYAEWQHF